MKARQLLLIILSFFGMLQMAKAIPAYPHPIKVTQPDGTVITIRLHGDEHGYMVTSEDGQPLVRNAVTGFYEPTTAERAFVKGFQRAEANLSPLTPHLSPRKILINDFPAFGTQRSLVILVEYTDVKFTTIDAPYTYYYNMLNQEGFTHANGANGSARDFYHACSFNQFDPQFDVVGPIQLPHEQGYYGGDSMEMLDTLAYQQVIDACQLADETVDFSQYDLNNDGIVDNIYFFYAGYGQADSGQGSAIWPHAGKLQDDWKQEPLVLDGVTINRYATSNEIRFGSGIPLKPVGIGTFVHEFGHVLGLADHYDTMKTSGRIGVNDWDTMAAASYHNNQNTPPLFSAFERAELGWLSYTDIQPTTEGLMKLHDLKDANKALRIVAPDTDGHEYFIMENRQQTGWDKYLPGHGILVWHIDMAEDVWPLNQVNVLPNHQRIDIVEADGSEIATSYQGDPFPGTQKTTQFDFHAWNGEKLFAFDFVEETDTTANILLANTAYHPATPQISADEVHGAMMVLSWPAINDMKEYELTISEANDDNTIVYHALLTADQSPLTIEGLNPNTTYNVEMIARLSSYESDVARLQVTTTDLEFFELQPVALPATNIREDAFVAHWQPMEGADDYSLTLYQHEYSEEQTDSYDFTDKADSMPEGWSTTSGTFNRAFFGDKAPSLQLAKADDYLLLSYDGALITGITFWQRSQSKNNLLHVETLADGEWQELETISGSTQGNIETLAIDSCQTLRLRFERKSGYFLLDDIIVSYTILGTEPVYGFADIHTGLVSQYELTGLFPYTNYGYRVRALQGEEQTKESEEVAVVLTAVPTGIVWIDSDTSQQGPSEPAAVFDLQGRRLSSAAYSKPGIYILRGKKMRIGCEQSINDIN